MVPELEVGEVLLFLKYLFASNTARFFSKQDLPILTKVGIYSCLKGLSHETDLTYFVSIPV